VVNECPAVMENVLEQSPKTNHTGNFSVVQYYFKKKSHKNATKGGPTYC